MPGWAAAGTLRGGHWHDHWQAAAKNLLSQQHHIGFRLWSFLVALTGFGLTGDAGYHQQWVFAWILSLSSVAVIGLVALLALRSGADQEEATVAACFAAGSTALMMYARHLHPYDTGLALDLLALWIGLRPGGLGRAFMVGLVAATGFLTYYAYLSVAVLAGALHLTRGTRRAQRAVLAGLGAAIPFLLAEGMSIVATAVYFPGREPYHVALLRLLRGAPESWGSSYAEGWWVPWAYLWHAEHLLGLVWLALIVVGWRERRVWLWGGAAIGLYGWLAVHSTLLHEAVVLGRFARQIVPFLCLAAAAGYRALRVRAPIKVLAGALFAITVAMNFTPLLTQRFPPQVRRAWAERYGPLAYDGTIEGPHGDPGDVTSAYIALNVEPMLMTWPVKGVRDVAIAGHLVESYPHPLAWPALQYEGYTAEAREALRSKPFRMELWQKDQPPEQATLPTAGHPLSSPASSGSSALSR